MQYVSDMKTNGQIEVGALVVVGMRFEMGDRAGQGRMVADEYTGRTFRVVALRKGKRDSAELAPSNIVGADESDAVVDIVLSRLTVQGEWGVQS